VFDDRLEVWSTGRLPGGLTPEKLKGTHDSVPRNPLIADVFHRRGLIEQWGRGTNKILTEAADAGCPEPEANREESRRIAKSREGARRDRRQPQARRKRGGNGTPPPPAEAQGEAGEGTVSGPAFVQPTDYFS
jgi:predicted HTH transcriptional regulator